MLSQRAWEMLLYSAGPQLDKHSLEAATLFINAGSFAAQSKPTLISPRTPVPAIWLTSGQGGLKLPSLAVCSSQQSWQHPGLLTQDKSYPNLANLLHGWRGSQTNASCCHTTRCWQSYRYKNKPEPSQPGPSAYSSMRAFPASAGEKAIKDTQGGKGKDFCCRLWSCTCCISVVRVGDRWSVKRGLHLLDDEYESQRQDGTTRLGRVIQWIMEWFGLEGTLKITQFQPPCHEQGPLPPKQGAQSPVQPGLEHCQAGGSHSSSRKPGPGPHHPHKGRISSLDPV